MLYRYSRWDGTQGGPDLDADDLLEALADDLVADGDIQRALRRLLQRGVPGGLPGQRMPGLQDLLQRLRRNRQQALDRYDLGSALEDLQRRLDEILRTEREGIDRRVNEARERAERGAIPDSARQELEQHAARSRAALDRLPPDAPGRVRGLQQYSFMDPEAWRQFQDLLRSLQQQMLQPFLQGMTQALQGMGPGDRERLRAMLRDLNRMLRQRLQGEEPDFGAFRDTWGQLFPGAGSLDALLEHLARHMARMQSLLDSMSADQRRELGDLMRSLFLQDERLEAELAQLGMHLSALGPLEDLRRQYEFQGRDPLTLQEAMRLMERLSQMEDLERQLRRARDPRDLDRLDPAQVEALLGPEAAQDLQRLRDIARQLEEAGYLERRGDRLELTARAIRKIGDKALRDIFGRLKRDRFGQHAADRRGVGGERTDDTKPWAWGDPFLLDLRRTLMRAVERRGRGAPVTLEPGDFEVYRTEQLHQASTVVMLDLSRSMINNGCFVPAKRVALALASLIRTQFPRDHLYIVGFSLYARPFDLGELPRLAPSEWNIGTNMHAGFMLSRQLLGRHAGGNRQIIMITDGEPTAHMEGLEAEFAYPPTPRTFRETLREVQRCTREGITINTFMLDRSATLQAFVEQMARINRGRAFFATPERLGEYLLVDYVTARRLRAS